MSLKISNETRSKAYGFMKSLLKDGADGNQINELVNDIGDHVSKDIAGSILMDMLKNPDEAGDDVRHRTHWFGPVRFTWYHAIIRNFTKFLREHEIRGYVRYGEMNEWERWRELNKDRSISDSELKRLYNQADEMIIVFDFWADDLIAREANDLINDLFNATKKNKNEKN